MIERNSLFIEIRELINNTRKSISRGVNYAHVRTNFEIGRRIVDHEQAGTDRAEYGNKVLRELSSRLTAEFGRGFSKRNLEYMRRFYLEYRLRLPRITQTPFRQLLSGATQHEVSMKYSVDNKESSIVQTGSAQSSPPFLLSWSQYSPRSWSRMGRTSRRHGRR